MSNSGPPLRLPPGVLDAAFVDADPVEEWAMVREVGSPEPIDRYPMRLIEQWATAPGPAAEGIEMLAALGVDIARCHRCGTGVGFAVIDDEPDAPGPPVGWVSTWIVVETRLVIRVLCEDDGNAEMGV